MNRKVKGKIWAVLAGLYTAAYMDGMSEDKIKTDVAKKAQREIIDIINNNYESEI